MQKCDVKWSRIYYKCTRYQQRLYVMSGHQHEKPLKAQELLSHILQVQGLSQQYEYQPSCIIAMDETPVWDDMVLNTTVGRVRASSINLKTTGHEKVMVTVCLSARANGTKLKPFIVFRAAKRETKKLNENFRHKCVVTTSSNAWMNDELTLNWVKSGLQAFSFNRRLQAWDSYECHTMQSVKEALHRINVDQVNSQPLNEICPGTRRKLEQAFQSISI